MTQANPLYLVATQGHPLRHFMAVLLETVGDPNTSLRVMTREESTPRQAAFNLMSTICSQAAADASLSVSRGSDASAAWPQSSAWVRMTFTVRDFQAA